MATGAAADLAALLKARDDRLTSAIVRRDLRKWLSPSDEGTAAGTAVSRIQAGG